MPGGDRLYSVMLAYAPSSVSPTSSSPLELPLVSLEICFGFVLFYIGDSNNSNSYLTPPLCPCLSSLFHSCLLFYLISFRKPF